MRNIKQDYEWVEVYYERILKLANCLHVKSYMPTKWQFLEHVFILIFGYL
jgi:hypothetical protein